VATLCNFTLKKAAKPQPNVVDEMLNDVRLAHHRLLSVTDTDTL